MGQRKSQQQNPINPLDFFRERGGKVIETEFGWCNYYLGENGRAYLENFHVYEQFRKSQKGTSLLMRLETQLKEIEGVSLYFTTISRFMGDCNKTLLICLKRGFKFQNSDADAITLSKEL